MLLIVSTDGHGAVDARDYGKLARDRDPDPDDALPAGGPSHRVLLLTNGGRYDGPPGTHWWHIFHAHYSQLRAAGFSHSGRSLVVATSSDITLLIRAP